MAFAFTLATNLIATGTPPPHLPGSLLISLCYLGLLAYRIWSVGAQTYRNFDSTYKRSPLRPILFVIIESGMIYSAMLTLALITVIHAPAVEWVVNGVVRRSVICLIPPHDALPR